MMTSLEIAEVTGKQHKNVMQAIRKMEPAWEKVNGLKFQLVEYQDHKGELRPCYSLTKIECLYIATKFSHESIANLKRVCGWLEVLRKRYNERYNACHLDNHPSVMSSGVETSHKGDHEISWTSQAAEPSDPCAALSRDDKGGALGRDDKEKPIIINSGYRSPQLNKKIGGVAGSNHLTGCAVDIRVLGMEQLIRYATILLDYADESHQDFDELLIERNRYGAIWLHFAVRPFSNRRKVAFIRA